MKNTYKVLFSFSVLVFVTSCSSYKSTNNELDALLVATQQTMNQLAEKIATTEKDSLTTAFIKLEEKSKELFPALVQCNAKYKLTKAYMTTLEEAQKVLVRLDDNFASMEDRAFVLNAIYLDYDSKLKSINSSATSDANTRIKVTVDSNEDDGFFVFGKLSYEQDLAIKRFRFNRPTQNASLEVVPGYYLFWLEKEGRVGTPELHLIMSDGSGEPQKLVLKTPK
ncbi:hypothetical protein FIA58_000205 [Flavobacterium jejuense]|uniref:Gliding motility-associated protein GldM N-terminal domain-containing protein n=1 Tax=Flavobacterium jejuense TaxID=1544455 RepID=A0ABX0IK39_9FLAO|nr:hypothetical protein [Flavobacterium jejuense]NHN24083.1 hypothetical protein [Flavobacterium jejuense]